VEIDIYMLKLKIPPPIYMLIMAGFMWILDRFIPVIEIIAMPWNRLGILVMFVAMFTDGLSLLQFFRVHTSINPIHPEKSKVLVTTGLYKHTRNPMYLGLFLLLLGWGIFLASVSPFIVLPFFIVVLTVQQIIPEEKILEQKFGQPYKDYKQSVKRWL